MTIPPYLNEKQRKASEEACSMANVNCLALLEEPIATVMSFGLETFSDKDCNILVIDFGGTNL